MKAKLVDVFDLQMGKTPSRNNSAYWNGEHKWISIADIGNARKYICDTKEKITDAGVTESGIKAVPPHTVIMSFKLSIGKTAITSEQMYTNEAIIAFVDKGTFQVDTNYLYHFCCGTEWTNGSNKAVMGLTLNKATLSEKMIFLPSIEEQRTIAAKLDTIDCVIEKTQAEIVALDDLVKSRFVEMFSAHSMKNCKRRIGDYADVLGGYAFKSDLFCANAIPVIRISNINDGGVTLDYSTCFSKDFWMQNKRFRAEQMDIMMAMSGATTGKAGLYTSNQPALINQRVACIRALSDKACPEFLFVATQLEWMYGLIQKTSAGCAQPNISAKQIENMPVPDATYEEQRRFAAFVEQVDKSKSAVKKSLEELEVLKKSLMQKYFG